MLKSLRASLKHFAGSMFDIGFARPLTQIQMNREVVNYAREVGDGSSSGVVMAPVQWICRTFAEAPLVVRELKPKGEETHWDHEMVQLIRRPNEHYTGKTLWWATNYSLLITGNAYWIKGRNERTRAVESLWWAHPGRMKVRGGEYDPTEFITHYEYSPGRGKTVDYAPEDVVHFRYGVNLADPRYGLAPLYPVLREVFVDDEAANYAAALLVNMGVPGLVVSPKGELQFRDPTAVKGKFDQMTTGANRASTVVLDGATDVEQIGTDPRRMVLSDLRNIPEERVCAALGLQPAVVPFGSGLEVAKVGATMREIFKSAWRNCIIPLQADHAETLTVSLLPEFEPRPDRFVAGFAYSEVPALADDENEKTTRMVSLFTSDLLTRRQALEELGYEGGDDIYYGERAGAFASLPLPKGIKEASPLEQRVIDGAQRARATRAQRAFMIRLQEEQVRLEDEFAKSVEQWAERFGAEVESASQGILKHRKPNGSHMKDAESDTAAIMERLDLQHIGDDLTIVYETEYIKIAQSTYATVGESLGLVIGIPDERATEITRLGGTQRGLTDLTTQTRDRLFRELGKARDEGLGVPATARRIREFVPAGRYRDVATRAKVIARTETLNAQRRSVMTAYRDSGKLEQVMVFDNRTGFNDAECTALDGVIVNLDTADQLAADEHPNGTRSFAPVL